MLNYKESTVYFNKQFVPFSEATLSIASSSVLYGLTVYTVFSANWNDKQQKLYAFRLKDHYRRLVSSSKIMDFQQFIDDVDYTHFEKIVKELLQKNKVREDVLVRTAVYVDELIAGTKIHGLKNSFSAYVYPMGQILDPHGIHACVSSWQRTADNAQPSRAKINGSYINASLMKNEAVLNGYDEAIALDQHGHVAEGTVANLFIVRDGVLMTPNNATDILEGITRSSVIHLAQDLGIVTQQRTIDRSELYIADEIFMCGSSAKITPVLSVDKRLIGGGKVGVITSKLTQLYEDVQHGRVKDTRNWLADVYA